MRNYKGEYKNYQGTAAQKKNRASGNPRDNSAKNLSVTTKRANRSFPRNSKAGKK